MQETEREREENRKRERKKIVYWHTRANKTALCSSFTNIVPPFFSTAQFFTHQHNKIDVRTFPHWELWVFSSSVYSFLLFFLLCFFFLFGCCFLITNFYQIYNVNSIETPILIVQWTSRVYVCDILIVFNCVNSLAMFARNDEEKFYCPTKWWLLLPIRNIHTLETDDI